jgi:hypothetical protein
VSRTHNNNNNKDDEVVIKAVLTTRDMCDVPTVFHCTEFVRSSTRMTVSQLFNKQTSFDVDTFVSDCWGDLMNLDGVSNLDQKRTDLLNDPVTVICTVTTLVTVTKTQSYNDQKFLRGSTFSLSSQHRPSFISLIFGSCFLDS